MAVLVAKAMESRSISAEIAHISNPRIEQSEHYYNPVNTSFTDIGLKPKLISVDVISEMIDYIQPYIDRIDKSVMIPSISWRSS